MEPEKRITKKVLIVGAGENAYVIKYFLSFSEELEVVGFLDDHKEGGLVVGKVSGIAKYIDQGYYFFISIGNNAVRKKVYLEMKAAGAKFVNAIHPTAVIAPGVKLGENVMVGMLSAINVGSEVGNNSYINNHCNLDHDSSVGPHSHLAPGAKTGGGVKIGECTWVGIGALIRDHHSVGDNVMVGMGAVVVSNIPSDVTVVGNPARPFKNK